MHSNTHAFLRPLLLVVALTPACVLTPDLIGETLTGLAGGDHDDHTTAYGETGTTGDEHGASETSLDPAPDSYGAACELAGVGPDIQRTEVVPQPACDGGICLLVSDDAPLACEPGDDASCELAEGPGSVCGANGLCGLTPAFVEANARCTETCEVDTDCPPIPGCMTGTTCTTVTLIGELCCQKVCACNDHIFPAQVEDMQATCDADPELCS